MRFIEAAEGPVNRLPVLGAQHVEAKRLTRPTEALPIRQQFADRYKIPDRLGHLLAFDLQEAVMHPIISHHAGMKCAARLRDFVLVMRKDEIDAAAMDVEALAEMLP